MRPTASRLLRLQILTKQQVSQSGLTIAAPAKMTTPSVPRMVASAEKSTVEKLTDTMMAEKGKTWPSNLRIEKAEKKTLFWKVPREQRTQLKRLLREA